MPSLVCKCGVEAIRGMSMCGACNRDYQRAKRLKRAEGRIGPQPPFHNILNLNPSVWPPKQSESI